jgi:hypothetical protein
LSAREIGGKPMGIHLPQTKSKEDEAMKTIKHDVAHTAARKSEPANEIALHEVSCRARGMKGALE